MQKSLFTRFILSTTALSFSFAVFYPYSSQAAGLAPVSFEAMYNLAKSGNVQALRASVRRGMNIDVMDSNGDTGLCIAAQNNDHYTYNAFRAAGANPNHPCVQKISHYEDFLASSKTVALNATPREAFSAVGLENFHFQPNWWIIGGVVLAGGAAALALSSGGGGGKSSGGSGGDDSKPKEEYNSLASKLAANGSIKDTVNATSKANSARIDVTNSNTAQINTIDFTKSVLDYAGYINVGLNAKNGGKYTNESAGVIYLTSGAVGMSALSNSEVVNNGFIHADAYNGTIGMVGSQKSVITNNAAGIIANVNDSKGIDLNFSGKDGIDAVIGMYVDTNSQAINNGDIRGTAIQAYSSGTTTSDASTSIVGNIIGMEAMILNAGNDVAGKEIILSNNGSGNINISAGDGGSGTTVNLNSIGMGSFLDNAFLNGSKNINRAEVVTINNKGNISIAYTGTYSPTSDTTLRKGTGGVVGMRADANTTANNSGNINLNFSQYGSSSSQQGISAGMQSIHGANLTNSGNINITTIATNQLGNYGMLSVEGSGYVSGLYTDLNQKLSNTGEIIVKATNSYGMASYNGGTLSNSNHIAVGSATDTQYNNNVAMYGSGEGTQVTLSNTGTIDVYSYNSYAMKNDFAGAQTIQNDGTININYEATNSKVFGGYYSYAINNGLINYYITSGGSMSESGTDADDPFSEYTLQVSQSVLTTENSSTSSSTTELLTNNSGKNINIYGSSFTSGMSIMSARGQAENLGTINLFPYSDNSESNSVVMYMGDDGISSAAILNSGTINTSSNMSAAMASDSSQNSRVINYGTINTSKPYSIGLYASGRSVLNNYGIIKMNASESVGVYSSGPSNIINTGTITIGSAGNSQTSVFGLYSKGANISITNGDDSGVAAAINVYATGKHNAGIYASGDYNVVYNKSGAVIGGSIYNGISITGANNTAVNYGTISGVENGIFSDGEKATIVNSGLITASTYGIQAKQSGSNITNNGTITSADTGIWAYAEGTSEEEKTTITNNGTITAPTGIYVKIASPDVYLDVKNNGAINSTSYQVHTYGEYEKPLEPDEDFDKNISVIGASNWYKEYESYEKETQTAETAFRIPAKRNWNFINNGTYYSATALNFDNSFFNFVLDENASYVAPALSGTVNLADNVVSSGFENEYAVKNAFVGANKGIVLNNNLYMFENTLRENSSGALDAVATMRDFGELMKNQSLAKYLSANYQQQNNENLYSALKTTHSAAAFDAVINKKFALDFVPNLAKQNLDNIRIIDREINDELLEKTYLPKRYSVKVVSYKKDVDGKHEISGYKDKVTSVYGFGDHYLGHNMRGGYGLNVTRSDSDFDNDSSRYNNVVEAFAPVLWNKADTSALVKLKAGFGRGHYRRIGLNNAPHKMQTKEYYYGFDTDFRHDFDLGILVLEPHVGFDTTAMYMDNSGESNGGLKLKDENIVSAKSVIGLKLKKSFDFNYNQSLDLSAGGTYYHEFGNKYRQSVAADGMSGVYEIADGRMQRNFGLLNMKAKYQYKQFSLGVSANAPLEQKNNAYYMLDLGYKF